MPNIIKSKLMMRLSVGVLFMSQLLTAAHFIESTYFISWLSYNRSIEDLGNEHFKFSDSVLGLNVDYMSYVTWNLANKDSAALLNATTLTETSERTFQIFFQHFVTSIWKKEGTMYTYSPWDENNPYHMVNGTISARIKILTMNETAT
jgi:hypothetical protein